MSVGELIKVLEQLDPRTAVQVLEDGDSITQGKDVENYFKISHSSELLSETFMLVTR